MFVTITAALALGLAIAALCVAIANEPSRHNLRGESFMEHRYGWQYNTGPGPLSQNNSQTIPRDNGQPGSYGNGGQSGPQSGSAPPVLSK